MPEPESIAMQPTTVTATSAASHPDRREPNAAHARRVVRRLLTAGQRVPAFVRRDILDLDTAAVPALLEILTDEDLALQDAPGQGWAPAHAARLLGELRAVDAIEPMLSRLGQTTWEDVLRDCLLRALPQIGAPVVEPALRAWAESNDEDFKVSVASVLARSGVRDERIFEVLLDELTNEPSHAPGALAEYGDVRALPYLANAFDGYEIVPGDRPFANQDLVELRAAIEELGGLLTPAQEEKYARALEPADRWRERMRAALDAGKMRAAVAGSVASGERLRSLASPGSQAPARRRERLGRNDPCWCGSAKKYKKCHLAADEVGASGAGDGARNRAAEHAEHTTS